jgi:hypothetical protein
VTLPVCGSRLATLSGPVAPGTGFTLLTLACIGGGMGWELCDGGVSAVGSGIGTDGAVTIGSIVPRGRSAAWAAESRANERSVCYREADQQGWF